MKYVHLAILGLVACLSLAHARTPAAAVDAAPPALEGKTVEGRPFTLAGLKGKVVLVMFWNTDCAVCRDKMPELRENVQGWAGKPFELVLVSTDRRASDLKDYETIISRTVPMRQRFIQLWSGEPGYRDTLAKPAQLPASFLLDKTGRIVERYQGRIPADAWDKIAEML